MSGEPEGGGGEAALERALHGLRGLYADLDAELAALAPRCELSGRCCDFERSGLTLFATDLELSHLLRAAPPPPGPAVAAAADAAGGGEPRLCPWWRGGLCHAREGRPLGCRVYFCDPSRAAALEEISMRYHARLKRLHDGTGGGGAVPYRYAPFVARVRALLAGRAPRAAPAAATSALTAASGRR